MLWSLEQLKEKHPNHNIIPHLSTTRGAIIRYDIEPKVEVQTITTKKGTTYKRTKANDTLVDNLGYKGDK